MPPASNIEANLLDLGPFRPHSDILSKRGRQSNEYATYADEPNAECGGPPRINHFLISLSNVTVTLFWSRAHRARVQK
jgi:hypothetical protein